MCRMRSRTVRGGIQSFSASITRSHYSCRTRNRTRQSSNRRALLPDRRCNVAELCHTLNLMARWSRGPLAAMLGERARTPVPQGGEDNLERLLCALRNRVPRFVGRDLRFVLQGEPDIIEAVEQAMAGEFVDLESR